MEAPRHRTQPRLRASCDGCHARKVKCDLKARTEALGATSGVTCTNCADHDLPCTVSKPKPRGKRLRQLHADATPSAPASFASASSASSSSTPPANFFNDPAATSSTSASFWSAAPGSSSTPYSAATPFASTSSNVGFCSSAGLFMIPGLDRRTLDACCAAYFEWSRALNGWVRGDRYTARYRSYFAQWNGLQSSVEPVSELLIIAVAAAGAALLEDEASVLGIDKFDLQQRLVNTFLKRIKEQKWSELSDLESLDLVNSCYILFWVATEDGEKEKEDADPFERSPLSDEFLASLVFKTKLNRAPKLEPRAPPGGPRWRSGRGERLLTDAEALQRARTFISLYSWDGCRTLASGRPAFFNADNHDISLNIAARPTYDGGFIEGGGAVPSVSPEGETEPTFEALAVVSLRNICEISREVAPTFVSVPSQTRGVPAQAAAQALDALQAWWNTLPEPVLFRHQLPINWRLGKAARPYGYQFQKLLRSLVTEMVYHGQILAAVHSVFAADLRSEAGEDTVLILARFASAALDGLVRVAEVCEQAASLGILRCSPVMCRNLPGSYALWLCNAMEQQAKGNERSALFVLGSSTPSYNALLAAADTILRAIATVDSAKGTPAMVAALRDTIAKTKAAVGGQESTAPAATLTDVPDDLLELFFQQQQQQQQAMPREEGNLFDVVESFLR